MNLEKVVKLLGSAIDELNKVTEDEIKLVVKKKERKRRSLKNSPEWKILCQLDGDIFEYSDQHPNSINDLHSFVSEFHFVSSTTLGAFFREFYGEKVKFTSKGTTYYRIKTIQ